MKIVWEAEDVVPGRILRYPHSPGDWMIGYLSDEAKDKDKFVLISMVDGMVKMTSTKEELAERLNASEMKPAELVKTSSERGSAGGRARAASMSPEHRSEVASSAAKARWAPK